MAVYAQATVAVAPEKEVVRGGCGVASGEGVADVDAHAEELEGRWRGGGVGEGERGRGGGEAMEVC